MVWTMADLMDTDGSPMDPAAIAYALEYCRAIGVGVILDLDRSAVDVERLVGDPRSGLYQLDFLALVEDGAGLFRTRGADGPQAVTLHMFDLAACTIFDELSDSTSKAVAGAVSVLNLDPTDGVVLLNDDPRENPALGESVELKPGQLVVWQDRLRKASAAVRFARVDARGELVPVSRNFGRANGLILQLELFFNQQKAQFAKHDRAADVEVDYADGVLTCRCDQSGGLSGLSILKQAMDLVQAKLDQPDILYPVLDQRDERPESAVRLRAETAVRLEFLPAGGDVAANRVRVEQIQAVLKRYERIISPISALEISNVLSYCTELLNKEEITDIALLNYCIDSIRTALAIEHIQAALAPQSQG